MDRSIGSMKTADGTGDRPPAGGVNISLGSTDTLRPADAPLGRIDQHELLRELGGGGFGVVYLARDTVAGIDVAVKGLPPLVRNNAEELDRIRENFALVSKLHHPHIAAALHLHPAQNVSYADERVRQTLRVQPGDTLMVMAYAPGVTLSKWRKQFPEGRVPVPQALEVCRQIAAALDYAHGERVVHRDVKPSNVMVETREKVRGNREEVIGEGTLNAQRSTFNAELCVRVLDFGLAAEIRSSMSRVSQEKGYTSGTRPYMAPEQWAGRRQDGRTDQYALAALFYELVSGAVPFASAFDTGDSAIMANAAKTEEPEPLTVLSKAQNAALLRGLAKEPVGRFATCGEFVAALGGAHAETRRRGEGSQPRIGRMARMGLMLAALVAVSMLSLYSIQSMTSKKAAAREQSAKLDAAQREKLEGLRAAAEAALAAGDLEVAGARIAELKGAGGPASVSAELQKRYESKAGEREANKRYAAASLAREAVQKLDAGQGFGERLKALETAWREAEAARQGQGWGQALSGYDAVLATCKTLEGDEASRGDAKTRRGEAEKAKEEADRAEAAEGAKELYENGGRASSRAAEAFEKGDFAEASKAWKEASAAYASAQKKAVAMQAYRKAKGDFETALAGDSVALEKHGGTKWAEVKEKALAGSSASAADPEEGARTYAAALAALQDAVKEAKAAEQELLAKKKAEFEYATWISRAKDLAGRLEREVVSSQSYGAKTLILEAEGVLAEANRLETTRRDAEQSDALRALKSKIETQKQRLSRETASVERQKRRQEKREALVEELNRLILPLLREKGEEAKFLLNGNSLSFYHNNPCCYRTKDPGYYNRTFEPLQVCHRALQNQPLMGGSKPASNCVD